MEQFSAENTMVPSNDLGSRLQQMRDALRTSPSVAMRLEEVEPLTAATGGPEMLMLALTEVAHLGIDEAFHRCFVPFIRFALQWDLADADGSAGGELALGYLHSAVLNPPELASKRMSSEERRLVEGFRVIDDQPLSGRGTLAAVRVDEGKLLGEVWFNDVKRGRWKLDVNYCGYLDALCVTKGYYEWQLLFADVDLAAPEFRNVQQNLERMLTVLPALFPNHDYSPLKDRLAARTKRNGRRH
jgi:hypothetical protein